MKNWKKNVGYVFASVLVIFMVLYWILDLEWARMPFLLSLCVLSLYNLFVNLSVRNKSDEED